MTKEEMAVYRVAKAFWNACHREEYTVTEAVSAMAFLIAMTEKQYNIDADSILESMQDMIDDFKSRQAMANQ